MILDSIIDFFKQSPVIPVLFSSISLLLIMIQCFAKRTFFKIRFLISILLVFAAAIILVFNDELKDNSNQVLYYIYIFGQLAIEIIVCVLLFTVIDLSLSNEKLHKVLTKSLDETKYYVLLDKNDKIKQISTLLADDLNIEISKAIGKNFFDVVENRYRIIGLNGEQAFKKDVKRYYEHYDKYAKEGTIVNVELEIQDDNAKHSALYFNENSIFNHSKYRGRILIGDKKTEESLVGMEKDIASKSSELDLIKSRFITLLNKTNEGVFFNTINKRSIWVNDVLVKSLCLNGNSISFDDFYNNIHKDDIALYKEVLNNLNDDDYSITYRYNTGAYYVYVKENGHKIISGDTVELTGIMSVVDDYKYEKTDTILDMIQTEDEMLARLQALDKADVVFEVVYFKIATIPTINEKFGRAIGNMMLSEYVKYFKEQFVVDNYIYRVTGLEFVAFITNYNKMETLKSKLRNDEKILHVSFDMGNNRVATEIYMGISYSNDTSKPKEALVNAKTAMQFASNNQSKTNYVYFGEIKNNG